MAEDRRGRKDREAITFATFPGTNSVVMAGLVPAIHVFLNGGGLVGIVFVQGPAIPAAYHAELRAMLYGAMVPRGNGATQ